VIKSLISTHVYARAAAIVVVRTVGISDIHDTKTLQMRMNCAFHMFNIETICLQDHSPRPSVDCRAPDTMRVGRRGMFDSDGP
jgi:hypothetical protein